MPTGLSVNPARQDHNPATITVRDIGTTPVHVTTSTWILHSHCALQTISGVHVSPGRFTLSPGQSVKVHARVPSGAAQDYGVLFTATAKGAHGDVVATSVGSQVLTGGASSCVHPAIAAPQHPAGGIPAGDIGAASGLVLVAAIAAAFMARRVRSRRRRTADTGFIMGEMHPSHWERDIPPSRWMP
jgi:hypothetical protein